MTLKGLIEKVERLEEELDNLDSRVKWLKRDVVIPFFTGEYEDIVKKILIDYIRTEISFAEAP